MAILSHSVQSTSIMDPNTLTKIIPVFVAIMVWLIRILIIGTLSIAGDRLFHSGGGSTGHRPSTAQNRGSYSNNARSMPHPISATPAAPRPTNQRAMNSAPSRPEPVFANRQTESASTRPEPTYHSISAAPRPAPRPINNNGPQRRL
jgi:hypothetical protein